MAGSSDDARTDMAADALRVLRSSAERRGRPYFTPEQARHLAAEFDRLRAELDRHRVAGDAMADALSALRDGGSGSVAAAHAEREWRSVRGDAPAAPAAAPTDGQAPADRCSSAWDEGYRTGFRVAESLAAVWPAAPADVD